MKGTREKAWITVDMSIFSVVQNELKILLVKRNTDPYRRRFALPGGFVYEGEGLDEAAARELYEETNVKNIFLKRLHPFGNPKRDPRGRVVTISYLAIISPEKADIRRRKDTEAEWLAVHELPKLAFDHNEIVDDALRHLRFEVQTTNIAYQLMRPKFTLTELQQAYDVVLGKELDKRNFRKWIKTLDMLKPLRETKMEGAHRPAQLFKFKDEAYSPLKERMSILLPFNS
jgi:8-oxo-dGTP diphosphatase